MNPKIQEHHRSKPAYIYLRQSTPSQVRHHQESTLPLYPRGPSLRSGLCCPGPSSLNRPHPPHSRAHPDFTVSAYIPDAFAVQYSFMPRRPTTDSELSLMVFLNMSSSETTGNSSAAHTQYFTENAGLRLHITASAFPTPPHSDSDEGDCFRGLTTVRLRYGLSLCLPSLSELTGFSSSQRGRLLPSFRRLGHPRRRRMSLRCQLGNLHRRTRTR
jgi:hypothetical protein